MTELQRWRDLGQDPPSPSGGALAEVRRRARRRVAHRRLAALGAVALVLATGGAAATLAGDGQRPVPDRVLSPEITVRPGCASAACPERDRRPPADCTDPRPGIDFCPDGRSGWSTGFTSCRPTDALDRVAGARPPSPGVSMRLELASTTAPAGPPLQAAVVVRNDSGERVAFTVRPGTLGDFWEARALGPGGGNARHGTDVAMMRPVELEPGQTGRVPLLVPTVACADTMGRTEPALPPGSYDVSVRLLWSNVEVGKGVTDTRGERGAWAGTAELTLTR